MKSFILYLILSLFPVFVFAQEEKITAPSAPLDFVVTPGVSDDGKSSPIFDLSWVAPENDGGSTINGYNVYYRMVQKGEPLDWTSYSTSDLSYTVSEGISAGLQYEFGVSAYNFIAEGPMTETITETALSGDMVPPVISRIEVLEITNDSAKVSWFTDELATSSISFDVHSADQHQSNFSEEFTTEHSLNLTGLLPCTTYFYYVKSVDLYENVSYSNIDSFDTTGCLGGVLSKDSSDLIPPEVLAAFEFNDSVDISVQQGTFGADSVFQVKRLNIKEVDANVGCPANKKPIGGRVYDIKFLDDFNSETNLSSPATISIRYEEDDIIGVNENDISMYHYNEDVGAWQKLDSCILDTENNTVTCTTDDFSKFMLSDGFSCPKSSWTFNKYMFLGSIGKQVKELQKYLNENGYFVSYEGRGAPGMETNFFGLKTRRALKDFQSEYSELFNTKSLEYRLGIFGKQTKDLINP